MKNFIGGKPSPQAVQLIEKVRFNETVSTAMFHIACSICRTISPACFMGAFVAEL
jgi:hypothetical protein